MRPDILIIYLISIEIFIIFSSSLHYEFLYETDMPTSPFNAWGHFSHFTSKCVFVICWLYHYRYFTIVLSMMHQDLPDVILSFVYIVFYWTGQKNDTNKIKMIYILEWDVYIFICIFIYIMGKMFSTGSPYSPTCVKLSDYVLTLLMLSL